MSKDDLIALYPWPLIICDFEASALSNRSYPIEVGLCVWRSASAPLEGWSTLIRPTEEWRQEGDWSPQSATVHGISIEELETGLDPVAVVEKVEQILKIHPHHTIWVDGGASDVFWAKRLAAASGGLATMRVGDFDTLTGALDHDGLRALTLFLDRSPAPHRAREDAERLAQALAYGLGLGELARRDLQEP